MKSIFFFNNKQEYISAHYILNTEDPNTYGTCGFEGSISISESFVFRSQFEPLYIIFEPLYIIFEPLYIIFEPLYIIFYHFYKNYFFVGIYILNEKVLNKQIRKVKDC